MQVSEMSPYKGCDVTAGSLVQLIPDLQLAIKQTADYSTSFLSLTRVPSTLILFTIFNQLTDFPLYILLNASLFVKD